MKSQFCPNLHLRMCRVPLPDLNNGWTDCVQIWYIVRDRLVWFREMQLEAPTLSSACTVITLSLARLPLQKVSYWLIMTNVLVTCGLTDYCCLMFVLLLYHTLPSSNIHLCCTHRRLVRLSDRGRNAALRTARGTLAGAGG